MPCLHPSRPWLLARVPETQQGRQGLGPGAGFLELQQDRLNPLNLLRHPSPHPPHSHKTKVPSEEYLSPFSPAVPSCPRTQGNRGRTVCSVAPPEIWGMCLGKEGGLVKPRAPGHSKRDTCLRRPVLVGLTHQVESQPLRDQTRGAGFPRSTPPPAVEGCPQAKRGAESSQPPALLC